MKQWTQEERYRVLQSPDEIKDLHERNAQSIWRQTYHVQPVTGLSSDPNGFGYWNGTWHLFYQWCPWGAVHGLKYWYHVSSPDLVHWTNLGIGLKPDTIYDNKGNHSGSAIPEGDNLYLFYTGNHRDENWVRTPYTCVAKMDADGTITKNAEPLFGPRDDYEEHQRDPKVFWVEEKQMYYIFIGAMTMDKKGCVLVYHSKELLSGWSFAGQLSVPGYEDFGGMWECPCIQNISGKDVLLFSPQYTTLPGRGNSTNHNVYLVGKMDYDTLTFIPEGPYEFLDYGFDFYAAQLASNVGDPDKAIIIGWIGLPDNHYPSEEDEWEGTMIVPRELTLQDAHLISRPVDAVKDLRQEEITPDGTLPNACDIELTVSGDLHLALFTKDGEGGFTVDYDQSTHTVTADKSKMALRFNEQVFEQLTFTLRKPLKSLRMLIDSCSVELFFNDGEETFTAHAYPTKEEHGYSVDGADELHIWPLTAAVKDDFVV